MSFRLLALLLALGAMLSPARLLRASEAPARVTFGEAASEQAAALRAERCEIFTTDAGISARRLLPLFPQTWTGGSLFFRLSVDPVQANYLTVRFWDGEENENRLMLYIDGRQVGYRHLGEVDLLDYGSSSALQPGKFFYTTTPLPLAATQGRTELTFEIRATGRIWGYGTTFDAYQKTMTVPSRAIFAAYTHTDGCFTPPADERQTPRAPSTTTRREPSREVLLQAMERVNRELQARLTTTKPLTQMQLQLLARAYEVKWTVAYRRPEVIQRLIAGVDWYFAEYRKNPKLAQAEPSTWNPDWFGLGVCGEVIALRRAELAGALDESISDGRGGQVARRAAWAEMLRDCRDWHRQHRRQYTNQTMLNDLHGIYNANRGLAVVAPELALPETEARRYLYESVGLEPWRGSDPGAEKPREWNVGAEYWQLTDKALTKELGYVGGYGEVIDLVADIYEATRPAPGAPGDERIREQFVKIARARAPFRHPSVDEEGNRTMRLEQVIGWRDSHYPGYVAYGQRATRDASPLQAAALTLDPHLVGYAQQMLEDNQFFLAETEAMADGAQPLRTTIGRLAMPEHYALLRAQPPSPHRLPMTPGGPDYVFADEENGVLALKHGDEILYASLYWRARHGVNSLARIHHITPAFDRVAVVRELIEFKPSGLVYRRPDWTNFGFGNGGPKYPGEQRSIHAGEELPIARMPEGIDFKPGQESAHAGRGDLYVCRYGDYLIVMNSTKDETRRFAWPAGIARARDLVTQRELAPDAQGGGTVAPRSTMVLWFGAR